MNYWGLELAAEADEEEEIEIVAACFGGVLHRAFQEAVRLDT